jgi:hypothetical protein
MTQPYGGQQPQQPGGSSPGSGGFQQPGQNPNYQGSGGYPQAPGYQQGYGGMPAAPEERGGGGPVRRPGVTTAAAVLAFVQSGLTLITTGILLLAVAALESVEEDARAGGMDLRAGITELWIISIVQVIGIALLIWGGVKLMSGTSLPVFIAACGLQVVLCVYWLVRSEQAFVPLLLIVMPIVALALALGGASREYVRSRSGGR